MKADIEAIFEFNEERKGKVASGFRPSHLVKGDYLTTGLHKYYEADVQTSGNLMGTITFISPEEYQGSLWEGKRIPMYDGSRFIGDAIVTKIFNPILKRNSLPAEDS